MALWSAARYRRFGFFSLEPARARTSPRGERTEKKNQSGDASPHSKICGSSSRDTIYPLKPGKVVRPDEKNESRAFRRPKCRAPGKLLTVVCESLTLEFLKSRPLGRSFGA